MNREFVLAGDSSLENELEKENAYFIINYGDIGIILLTPLKFKRTFFAKIDY